MEIERKKVKTGWVIIQKMPAVSQYETEIEFDFDLMRVKIRQYEPSEMSFIVIYCDIKDIKWEDLK